MLIDTHCHLDAPEFAADRAAVAQAAQAAGVAAIVMPAIAPMNFDTVRTLATQVHGGAYALGIHPLFVHDVADDAIDVLRTAVQAAMDDPRFVAIGEIGLDLFVKAIASGEPLARQERFLAAQLRMAAEFDLPVLLHVRRSQDLVHKHLRQIPVVGGIAHAFNGSEQQADRFLAQGLALGVGGAMTFPRALQIRRHAERVGLEHLVLETDAPDIPPAWLTGTRARNAPGEIAGIAQALATLRGDPVEAIVAATGQTACRQLPRLGALLRAGAG